jgi:hypothetical protein
MKIRKIKLHSSNEIKIWNKYETTPRNKCHNTPGLPLLCLQYKQEMENRKVTLLDVQSHTVPERGRCHVNKLSDTLLVFMKNISPT